LPTALRDARRAAREHLWNVVHPRADATSRGARCASCG
jgi:hypothetical protein